MKMSQQRLAFVMSEMIRMAMFISQKKISRPSVGIFQIIFGRFHASNSLPNVYRRLIRSEQNLD